LNEHFPLSEHNMVGWEHLRYICKVSMMNIRLLEYRTCD